MTHRFLTSWMATDAEVENLRAILMVPSRAISTRPRYPLPHAWAPVRVPCAACPRGARAPAYDEHTTAPHASAHTTLFGQGAGINSDGMGPVCAQDAKLCRSRVRARERHSLGACV